MKETYYTDPSKWREDLSFNVYVPITCDDVVNLHTFDQLVKFHRIPNKKLEGPGQYFFGNHPMKWIRVSGHVVDVEYRENHSMCLFKLNDGFGNTSLQCVLKSMEFTASRLIEKNMLLVVFGELSTFGAEVQVVVQKVIAFPPSDMLRYYFFREEALCVRKYFLERSADEFKLAVQPVVIPKLTLTQLSIPEVLGLQKSLKQKSSEWTVPWDSLLTNPKWVYPSS